MKGGTSTTAVPIPEQENTGLSGPPELILLVLQQSILYCSVVQASIWDNWKFDKKLSSCSELKKTHLVSSSHSTNAY